MGVARKHQLRIAKHTLRMTPIAATILGEMSFEQAYQVVYGKELRPRLKELILRYPNLQDLSWELQSYGWNPKELLHQL